jgi:hypothetical protein
VQARRLIVGIKAPVTIPTVAVDMSPRGDTRGMPESGIDWATFDWSTSESSRSIAKRLGVDRRTVDRARRRLVVQRRRPNWSAVDWNTGESTADLAARLGCSIDAVRRNRPKSRAVNWDAIDWSEPDAVVAERVGLSVITVRLRRYRHVPIRRKVGRKPVVDWDVALLPNETKEQAAKRLGLTVGAVYSAMKKRGLPVTRERLYLADDRVFALLRFAGEALSIGVIAAAMSDTSRIGILSTLGGLESKGLVTRCSRDVYADALLGLPSIWDGVDWSFTDSSIAGQLGVDHKTVTRRRLFVGVQAGTRRRVGRPSAQVDWSALDWSERDAVYAKRFGVAVCTVRHYRRLAGIRRKPGRPRKVAPIATPADELEQPQRVAS